ncbi:hypothetical protein ARMGADRAFT_1017392 [Armillaria gallica]|uniref:Uncharacterized protein n=1 Tax=Armillaria gallica TaxID=47427 RepID=A0A2H3DBE8_ARMGA|nr:hypothetical protein ARMGADRAFT_1017392 [Armillaria gallica]
MRSSFCAMQAAPDRPYKLLHSHRDSPRYSVPTSIGESPFERVSYCLKLLSPLPDSALR